MRLGMTTVQRSIATQLKILQSFKILKDAKSAATTLLEVCDRSERDKCLVIQLLTTGSGNRLRTIASIFTLADHEVWRGAPLEKTSLSARLLRLVMQVSNMTVTIYDYLSDHSKSDGAAGIRYLFKKWPATLRTIPDLERTLLSYCGRVLSVSRPDQTATMRLLELIIRRNFTSFDRLGARSLEIIRRTLLHGHSYDTPAALHVARTLTDNPPDVFLDRDLIDAVLSLVTNDDEPRIAYEIFGKIEDNHEAELKIFAFAALAVLLKYRPPLVGDAGLIQLSVDVLFWKTERQHKFSKKQAVRHKCTEQFDPLTHIAFA